MDSQQVITIQNQFQILLLKNCSWLLHIHLWTHTNLNPTNPSNIRYQSAKSNQIRPISLMWVVDISWNCQRPVWVHSTISLKAIQVWRSFFWIHSIPIIAWCVGRWGPKNKHHNDTWFIRDWTASLYVINCSTLNSKYNREDSMYSI